MRIAINGFGRIGRAVLKIAIDNPEIEIVAINDLAELENLIYLLNYDTVYRIYKNKAEVKNGNLVIAGKQIKFFSEKNPVDLPWSELEIDLVIEATGFFTNRAGAEGHLKAGAKKVLISAPTKDETIKTIVCGVNDDKLENSDDIISNASCTTNCVAPMMKVLEEKFGVDKSLMSTIHSYTSTQALVDGPAKKDMRRGRAAACNVVPTSTGAALAAALVVPELKGVFDGMAYRVPTPVGSISDVVIVLKKEVTKEEIIQAFKEAERGSMKNIIQATDEPLVSSDILGSTYSVIVPIDLIKVVGGNLVKVVGWYDNEWGYSCRVIDLAIKMFKF